MSWQLHEVGGKPFWFLPSSSAETICLVYLHGYDEGSHFPHTSMGQTLREAGLVCVVPIAGNTWWLHRRVTSFDAAISPEELVVQHVVAAVRQRWNPRLLGLVGVGMGGQGALRIAFRHPQIFPGVAAVNPWVDFHQVYWEDELLQEVFPDPEAARQHTATLWINPLHRPAFIWMAADPQDRRWYPGAERLHEKLLAIGVPHLWETFSEDREEPTARTSESFSRALRSLVLGLQSLELKLAD